MRQVWFKHGARNALMPLATFLGPAITGLLAGAAITERIFSWPGFGRLTIDALTALHSSRYGSCDHECCCNYSLDLSCPIFCMP